MYRDPSVVVEETVANLKMLAEYFSEAIEMVGADQEQTRALHRYREARSGIASLVPKLNAAIEAEQSPRSSRNPYCLNCD